MNEGLCEGDGRNSAKVYQNDKPVGFDAGTLESRAGQRHRNKKNSPRHIVIGDSYEQKDADTTSPDEGSRRANQGSVRTPGLLPQLRTFLPIPSQQMLSQGHSRYHKPHIYSCRRYV